MLQFTISLHIGTSLTAPHAPQMYLCEAQRLMYTAFSIASRGKRQEMASTMVAFPAGKNW